MFSIDKLNIIKYLNKKVRKHEIIVSSMSLISIQEKN